MEDTDVLTIVQRVHKGRLWMLRLHQHCQVRLHFDNLQSSQDNDVALLSQSCAVSVLQTSI